MFNGFNKPTKNQIFGPSSTGGMLADARERQLYMRGEGLGSFFGSLFRRIIPAATRTIKSIANSKIVRDTGKQLIDSGINAATNVAVDAISGEKSVGDSISNELANARKDISEALKKANKKRKVDVTSDEEDSRTSNKRKKRIKKRANTKSKKKRIRHSVFDDDDY